MRKFGLIGYPLGHSFSQKYFTEKFAEENIPGCYENFPLSSLDDFPDLISANPDLCGLNVTIPYKTEILEHVDETDNIVREIGAANVLKIRRKAGKTRIIAYNSDVVGIRDSVLSFFQGAYDNALIIGTGGASKAVSFTLRNLGFRVLIVSRNKKGDMLGYDDVNAELLKNIRLIVNATPLGMFPDTEGKPDIDYNLLDERHTLFDLVYNPEFTLFLKKGKERGCKIITGIKMLYSQAERSWEIWNDDKL
ncbi:MAG: shikimate dehydrogenase [Bacteroidales bacterium]